MRVGYLGIGAIVLMGCASSAPTKRVETARTATEPKPPSPILIAATDPPKEPERPAPSSTWVGAAAENELLLAHGGEAYVGVWVDAPQSRAVARAPVDLALVIDTSGSMRGAKIENARAAARQLVESLADGDIVSVDTFSYNARALVPPTALTPSARRDILSRIDELVPDGSTNMFDGLSLGESDMARAPADHPVRRIVMISDGMANVGPSTPEALGTLAERALSFRAQVTSLGVGTEYDERTLDALAIRTSGRLFHLSDPREMTAILEREAKLLSSTVASDAAIELVPAPGVGIVSVGTHAESIAGGGVRIPLGALFAGQHREALVRVRVDPATVGAARALVSVRLRFHDPADGGIERLQEVVARAQMTDDPAVVASHPNAKTKAIIAVNDAAKLELSAAEQVNDGNFAVADDRLAAAEARLKKEAESAKGAEEKRRLAQAAASVTHARAATKAAAAAPAAMKRDQALQLNSSGMKDLGY